MPRVAFGTFAVDAPDGWADITAEVESPDPPPTLAHRGGVGALQFTVGLYTGVPVPNPSSGDLRGMVERFGADRGLVPASMVTAESGPPVLAAGSFAWGTDEVRAWVVSDGRNFALITHVSAAGGAGPELAACERIVRSIEFGPGQQDAEPGAAADRGGM